MLRTSTLLLAAAAPSISANAQPAPVARVQQTLMPPVTVVGRPTVRFSLAERMAHYRVPAVSVALIEGGRIAWTRAWGEQVAGVPATAETLFQAASVSKPVFAAAALQQVQSGRLSLDRPVNDHLTTWKVPDGEAKASAVTLRGLLSHSAGLSVHGFGGYAAGEAVPSLQQLLAGAKPANSEPVRPVQAPGPFRYSGGGVSVAQLALQDATGRPFADLVEQQLFRPLGMTSSSFVQPLAPARTVRAAVGHDGKGKPIPGRWHVYPEQAAAGLWTTPGDLARFALWVMSGRRAPAGSPQHFVASHLTQAQPGVLPAPHIRMGLGFLLEGENSASRFWHNGVNEGYRAYLLGFPETGQGRVIMTNGDGGAPLTQELLRALALEYRWPERFHQMLVPVPGPAPDLPDLAGSYRWGEEQDARIILRAEGDQLVAAPARGEPAPLVPLGANQFVNPQTGMQYRFEGEQLFMAAPNGPTRAARREQVQ
jgi:CubicO group peptidase (beta-lactamase class C family)